LIIVIGSDIDIPEGNTFSVEDLGDAIGENLGYEAKVLFCVGLYAAAYSSAITCPLGASLTAEQILADCRERKTYNDNDNGQVDDASDMERLKSSSVPYVVVPRSWLQKWRSGGFFFRGSYIVSIGVSVAISAGNVDTVSVILLAQVINGLLLPFIATALFLCLNDPTIMDRPLLRDNLLMLLCVFVTIFLAAHLIFDEISILAGSGLKSEGADENGEGAWEDVINLYLATGISVVGSSCVWVWRDGSRLSNIHG